MRYEKIDIKNKASMDYAALYIYLLDHSSEIAIQERPMIIICPGGGYSYTSDREAEIIAMQFLAFGYHAAVLRYSVAPARYPTALLEVGKAVAILREHAAEWHIHPDQIVVTGFSAGGHLAASFCMFWSEDWVAKRLGVASESLRPNGMILGYPVITSGEYAHRDSFKYLLGDEYEEKQGELSLENCVNENMPRSFIWHTFEDCGVPVQNSILLADALVKHHIPTELHIFEKGGHGLALANRLTQNHGASMNLPAVAQWIEMAHKWMEGWLDAVWYK